MSAKTVREMTDAEILNALEDAKEELFNLRFQRAAGKLEDLSRISIVRKNVARYKTVLRERQLAAELIRREEEEGRSG
ncbi:MAG: 50S ribosomal protein L29 [Anaerolineae bacterium]|nr:50S ribosomal protein L29 [Anaerolineae bacterium]